MLCAAAHNTYVNTWAGTVYVAFAIDVFSRRIVGWRARMSKETDLVLDAIDRGLQQRDYRPGPGVDKLVHHSDAGSQYQCHSVKSRGPGWQSRRRMTQDPDLECAAVDSAECGDSSMIDSCCPVLLD